MRQVYRVLALLFFCYTARAQETWLQGKITDAVGNEGLQAKVSVQITGKEVVCGLDGSFRILVPEYGEHFLKIDHPDFENKILPVLMEGETKDLGTIQLILLPPQETQVPIIPLTDAELDEDMGAAPVYSLLRAGGDIYLRRAAFDFGQAFFRLRGFDSRNTTLRINGFPMNSLYNGRPNWNQWGGLNDVLRNQVLSYGLQASEYGFGGLLGGLDLDTRPSGLRPGLRISGSYSNRSYGGRLMATYNATAADKPLGYTLSASRRWGEQGYIEGTLFDAWSAYAGAELGLAPGHSLHFAAILSSNRRGLSAPVSEEVAELLGTDYNPYWGIQDGKLRNSRERRILEPVYQGFYRYEGLRGSLQLGLMHQDGSSKRSRLGYYNAPNPDPVYYRKLPSFSINSPVGANFISARMAADAIRRDPQINWGELYVANQHGRAAYLLYDDQEDINLWQIQGTGEFSPGENQQTQGGVSFRRYESENFARIADLLGAGFHEDIDPFSETLNDVDGPVKKEVGDVFGYSFGFTAKEYEAFLQWRVGLAAWRLWAAGSITQTTYQREGRFLNGRYPESSAGFSDELAYTTVMAKGGLSYHLGGRYWFSLNGLLGSRPPLLKNSFINPRENNNTAGDLRKEQLYSLELDYTLRLPSVKGRLTAYYTRQAHKTEIRHFFTDGGLGSDFVQEVSTGLDQLHMGLELGLEYQMTPQIAASLVATAAKYLYASDPLLSINFDTAGPEENLINTLGNVSLGPATLKGLRLPTGPQQALSVGMEYRSPSYWWLGVTANYLGKAHISPSALTRTRSFLLDPETGSPFREATPAQLRRIYEQHPLENTYFLNLVFGKSWLRKGLYCSVFASVSNLFDSVYRTGGFEQARNGHYGQWMQDNLSGHPSFGPKYWYGQGRSFFLNLALSM